MRFLRWLVSHIFFWGISLGGAWLFLVIFDPPRPLGVVLFLIGFLLAFIGANKIYEAKGWKL